MGNEIEFIIDIGYLLLLSYVLFHAKYLKLYQVTLVILVFCLSFMVVNKYLLLVLFLIYMGYLGYLVKVIWNKKSLKKDRNEQIK